MAIDGKSGSKKWEFPTAGSVDMTPALSADGTLYVGAYQDKFYALDSQTGEKKWELEGSFSASSPIVGSDGTVFIATKTSENKMLALNGATGAKKWEFQTDKGIWATPAIAADGTIYFGSDDKKVYALDGQTGVKKWEFLTEGAVFGEIKLCPDGTVITGAQGQGKLYALDGQTGEKKWEFLTRFPTPDWKIGTSGLKLPAKAYEYIYLSESRTISLDSNSDFATDYPNGVPVSTFVANVPDQPWMGGTTTFHDVEVYINAVGGDTDTDGDGFQHQLYRINPPTGYQNGTPFSDTPFLQSFNSNLGFELLPTGAIDNKTQFNLYSDADSTPRGFGTAVSMLRFYVVVRDRSSVAFPLPEIGADGTVYLGSSAYGYLYALDGKTGARIWEYNIGDNVSWHPRVGSDDTVYISTNDGKLVAVAYNKRTLSHTLEYKGDGGTVSELSEESHDLGSSLSITPADKPGWAFDQWGGDYSGKAVPLTVEMDGNKSLTTIYVPDTSDADGDGLTAYDEVMTHKTDPNKADTTGDGFDDGALVAKGYSPTIDYTSLLALVKEDPGSHEFVSEIVQDANFRLGGMVVEQVGTEYELKYTVEKSTDLKNWVVDGNTASKWTSAKEAIPSRSSRVTC